MRQLAQRWSSLVNRIDDDKNKCLRRRHEYRYHKILQWRCRILCDNANVLRLFTIHNNSISHNKFLNDVYSCIDHIFVRLSSREKILNIISGLFYCDISDHSPNFISIKHNRTCCKDVPDCLVRKTQTPMCKEWRQKTEMIYIYIYIPVLVITIQNVLL